LTRIPLESGRAFPRDGLKRTIYLMLNALDTRDAPRHVVLTGMSWASYEQTLQEIGNRSIRVYFLDGVMGIMSPLPEDDAIKMALSFLIASLAIERRIPQKSFGSATFRKDPE